MAAVGAPAATHPTAPPAAPTSGWLFGPLPDLLFGCGLLYAIAFAAFSLAGPSLRSATPGFVLPLLILVLSSPHYGGTLVRVYEHRRDRQSYAVFTLWTTLALGALFFVALRSPLLASLLFTLYLTWSPWHYTGQNYGIAVMFLRRRGVDVTPLAKRWLYAAFILSFLLVAVVSHLEVGSAYSPLRYSGQSVTFLPIGISRGFGDVALPILGAAYLVSVGVSIALLRRSASRWRDLAPALVLMLTQALWFSLPFSVHYWGWQTGLEPLDAQERIADYTMMIFVGHGIQYLWITTYYARAGRSWHGYANYWAKAAAAGVGIWTLPAVLIDPSGFMSGPGHAGSLFAVIATFVNLHHFILDGAIWKLRNTRIAGVLIRSAPDQEADAAPERRWLRGAIWGVAGAGLAAAAVGFAAVYFYVPSALASGDLDRAERGVQLSHWLGSDEPVLRGQLVEQFTARGEFERAAAHAERLEELRPDGATYALIGEFEAARGNDERARAAFENAIASNAPQLDRAHLGLARIALARGDDAAAAEHLYSALALRPSSTAIANDLAWLLATSQDPAVRNAGVATAAAEALVKADEQPRHLDTLAAAYAAAGRFDDAVRTAARAEALAAQRSDAALLADIRRNLDRYRAGEPIER